MRTTVRGPGGGVATGGPSTARGAPVDVQVDSGRRQSAVGGARPRSTSKDNGPSAGASASLSSLNVLLKVQGEHAGSLQRLRQDHDALKSECEVLRKCLLTAGVLSEQLLEDEWRKDGGRKGMISPAASSSSSASPALAAATSCTGGTPTDAVAPSLLKRALGQSQASSSTAAASLKRVSAAIGAAPAAEARGLSPGPSSVLRTQRRTAAGPAAITPPASASTARDLSPRSAATSSAKAGARQGKAADRRPTPPRASVNSAAATRDLTPPRGRQKSDMARSRSRSESGSPSRRGVVQVDLFEMAQPLLQPGNRSAEQVQVTLSSIKRALQGGMASASRWKGPGTPMRAAVEARRHDFCRLLLQAGATPCESDEKGVSLLHSAVFDGHLETCKVLLEAKASPNVADRHGQTPLFFAPSAAICEILLDQRADVNIMNQKGQSALHLAGRAGLGDVLAWLGKHVSKDTIDLKDRHGASAAYYARHAGVSPDILLKNKLMGFDPPQRSGGKSRRADGHTSPRRTANTAGESDWLLAGAVGCRAGGRLPTLTEGSQDLEHEEDLEAERRKRMNEAATHIQAVRRGSLTRRRWQKPTSPASPASPASPVSPPSPLHSAAPASPSSDSRDQPQVRWRSRMSCSSTLVAVAPPQDADAKASEEAKAKEEAKYKAKEKDEKKEAVRTAKGDSKRQAEPSTDRGSPGCQEHGIQDVEEKSLEGTSQIMREEPPEHRIEEEPLKSQDADKQARQEPDCQAKEGGQLATKERLRGSLKSSSKDAEEKFLEGTSQAEGHEPEHRIEEEEEEEVPLKESQDEEQHARQEEAAPKAEEEAAEGNANGYRASVVEQQPDANTEIVTKQSVKAQFGDNLRADVNDETISGIANTAGQAEDVAPTAEEEAEGNKGQKESLERSSEHSTTDRESATRRSSRKTGDKVEAEEEEEPAAAEEQPEASARGQRRREELEAPFQGQVEAKEEEAEGQEDEKKEELEASDSGATDASEDWDPSPGAELPEIDPYFVQGNNAASQDAPSFGSSSKGDDQGARDRLLERLSLRNSLVNQDGQTLEVVHEGDETVSVEPTPRRFSNPRSECSAVSESF